MKRRASTGPGERTAHGQAVDRYGNRLDKDFSKGGGPFGNATTTLVDMWNRGFSAGGGDALDLFVKDPLRPMRKAPGRMYMVLAAQRLAAIVAMIRDFAADDTVSIVAHSQGCLLSLLAQAFLMQDGKRPADTLVLTHPPYSLVDSAVSDRLNAFGGGSDARMNGHYDAIAARQTMGARLRTLANIVKGVADQKQTTPTFQALRDACYHGVVGARWSADAPERDNRGKVYLYFCPDDMTVALESVQGIGWQGVPDVVRGSRVSPAGLAAFGTTSLAVEPDEREAMAELGPGFFQRVFTDRKRPPPGGGPARLELVGVVAPHDHVLRLQGEDDHDHLLRGTDTLRKHHPEPNSPRSGTATRAPGDGLRREGVRTINGERLKVPVEADLYAGAVESPAMRRPGTGSKEPVDPIDAAIAVTSDYGLQQVWRVIDDAASPAGAAVLDSLWSPSPRPDLHAGSVAPCTDLDAAVDLALNRGTTAAWQRRQIILVYRCLEKNAAILPVPTRKLLVLSRESADDARLRQQQTGRSARSFHPAIFGSAKNHETSPPTTSRSGKGRR